MAPPVGFLGRFFLRLLLNVYRWVALTFFTLKRWLSGNAGTAAEERILTGLFGEQYRHYCRRVPALGTPWRFLGYDA